MTSARRPLSVVMTVYNGDRFLAAAVESILNQTFADFDFHIVDDGSTDGTAAILAHYAGLDPRIIVHTQPSNRGFVEALNRGCRAATSDLIARMDADDISLPGRFAKQIAFLRDHPDIGVLGTSVQVIDEDDRMGRVWPCPSQPGLTAWTMLFVSIVAHPTVILRRALLEEVGDYPLGYTPVEDYALWIRLLSRTRVTNLDEVLVYYRNVSTSMSRAKGNRVEEESVRILEESVLPGLGYTVPSSDIRAMRELMHHRYPTDTAQIRRVGTVIKRLAAYATGLAPLTAEDVRAIRNDAGVRLWLLTALACRHGSLGTAARLARDAFLESPSSLASFAAKASGQFGLGASAKS